MKTNSSIFSFKKLPLVFLGSILIVVLIQAVLFHSKAFWRLCYLYGSPGGDDEIRLEAQLRTIPGGGDKTKVFLIGSSQTREDFDAGYLNREFAGTDLKFYNLGASGFAHPIEMFMLKDELLAKNPGVIIYVPFVGSFYSDYPFNRMRQYFNPSIIPYLLSYMGPRKLFAHRGELFSSFLGECSVFYKHRESLARISRTYLMELFKGTKRTTPKIYTDREPRSESYYLSEIRKAGGKKYYLSQFTGLNKLFFSLFAREVVSKGVKLLVISGPTHPLIKQCYPGEIDSEYNGFLADQAGEINYTYLSEARLPEFTEEEFADFTHLNALGRGKLTRFLEDYLK